MKKIKLSAVLLSSICHIVSAQNTSLPEPTTGSLSNYVNTAVSAATGVPNIGFPIYQLESSNEKFPVNASLSYHVYNAKPNVPASEVGQGWSLFVAGVITRQEVSDVDETKNWTDINEEQADIFYYTIPGHSGKFKIYRDSATGNPVLKNITGEKVKIEYEKDLSSTTFIINSFTITDDRGFQYLFEDYNIGVTRDITYSNYKTSFVLTKVKDPGGSEIVSYSYDKKIKYMGTSSIKKYQFCKINTISTGKGKLKFNYVYDAPWDDSEVLESDPFTLNSVSLTDPADRLQSRYMFLYQRTSFLADEESQNNEMIAITRPRPALTSIRKLDKNLAVVEETLFEYDEQGSSTQYGYYDDMRYGNYMCSNAQTLSPKKYTMGLLKKITFPTKGTVVYDFEANTRYLDRNSGNALPDWETQYYEMTETLFDTNITNNYPLTVTGSGDSYFEIGISDLYFNTDPHGNPIPFSYEMRRSGTSILTPLSCNTNILYKVFPDNYQFVTSGGAKGFIRQYTLKTMSAPFKNEAVTKAGARVKRIQSFDENGILVKTKIFEYQAFADMESSSGEEYYNDNYLVSSSQYDSFVLYKNVKETEIAGSENNGYIKYYFKTPNNYVLSSNTGYFPYYNLTSGGIMEKKEVYTNQNQLTESSDYEYSFQEITGVSETNIAMGTTKPSWLQYVKETSKSYLGQHVLQTQTETTFSPDNFQEIISKTTTNNGDINEVTTRYASDLNDTRFLNKNIIAVPLQVETKNNGVVMSKATTKYDNSSHFYPTSLETADLNQVSETQMTFDVYDTKGNLVQSTDKAGNSVTTIWGYYQTLPIAQITGAKYSNIASASTIAAAIAASNADADNPANEAALLTALENLRLDPALQQYPISVSAYDPLVGITHTVSSNGIKQSYEYDASGRLFRVKNASGQVIKENQYNYKP
ncbi:hypothetical protein PFY12_03110 [Chryseobacterium camelliae]|uniref:YD repeat-containing protein n=1 Tax=Chryseobacterium camelliae TaxID=1265445 RepID=A0ABY7QQ01_9FLAO|nr:hypothetical protein [Chryseobacterium camelliae]WBV61116.1 hypothetical protein PFY12_03110 [Chryseobacterium camelliae]